jgi:hypothetical protein
MMPKTEELLGRKAFERDENLFMEAMREAIKFHYENCGMYRKFCDKKGFDPDSKFALEEIPFFPVSLFKTLKLVSVPEGEIVKDISSSSTSGISSRIYLDTITARRQVKALHSIMSSFIGSERKDFIVFDSPDTIKSREGHLSSRATAIRGMLPFSKNMFFVLDSELNLDVKALEKAVSGGEVCFFGFTFLVHQVLEKNRNNPEVRKLLRKLENSLVLHIGGWKKLRDLGIEKPNFNRSLAGFLNTTEKRIIDIYGMTEQLGTIYPDCEFGYKHVPAYSEIIIRDVQSLNPVENGKQGFIQLLTPIPHSYPGISIISDDLGVIVTENCKCGRGKAFLFRARAEKAELKGCGDTIQQHTL